MSQSPTNIPASEVAKWLLHRAPFLLIDHASEFKENQSIIGHKKLHEDDPWFKGHFPNNPIMPGVLLIESMAQTGALLAAKSLQIDPTEKTILFSSVKKAKFKRPVCPPATLRIPVQICDIRRNFVQFSGEVWLEDTMVASCQFMAIAVENEP